MAQAAVESFYREYAKNAGVLRFPGGAQNRLQKCGKSDISRSLHELVIGLDLSS